MWPLIVGIGLAALLSDAFSNKATSTKPNKKGNQKKRIFISFAIEDIEYRNYLVEQSRNGRSPFTFIDMSVKHPWNEDIWQEKCRIKIKSCDGVIVLLSGNTWNSSGTRWEIKCAKKENIPIVGMHIRKWDKRSIPPELRGSKIIEWTWNNLEKTIKTF